ncbi:hypothetical protein L3X38_035488 [Prunus dulcis]|uniref:Uncharacterized protein n=1 Tax=Prunus dulcis TaxID=3755 RepID=A0AAD4VJS5_PRUDU|nr:hypothetical protein L3X38_035488 [Prunus dulcis]
MDFSHVIFSVIGFSSSIFFFVPNIKKWHMQQVTTEKLRIVNEALEQAEERAARFQERHDRILSQICSFYLINKELEDALAGARATMKEALEFAANLRRLQMKIITSFPSDQLMVMAAESEQPRHGLVLARQPATRPRLGVLHQSNAVCLLPSANDESSCKAEFDEVSLGPHKQILDTQTEKKQINQTITYLEDLVMAGFWFKDGFGDGFGFNDDDGEFGFVGVPVRVVP